MDVWAALLHGLVWHGPLMPLHKSHHEPRLGRFEKNDALSFLHAPIAIALVLYGCRAAPGFWREIAFGTGIGAHVAWLDIEVCRTEAGAPFVKLHGTAAGTAATQGITQILLSLSHSEHYAVANVVLAGC